MTQKRILGLSRADALFTVALLLASALTLWTLHRPKLTQLQALRERLTAHQDSRARLDAINRQVQNLTGQAKTLATRLADFEQHLIRPQKGAYLEIVSDIEDRCQVGVEQIVPGSTTPEGFYEFVPLTIVTRGSFQSSLCFLNELDSRFRLGQLNALRFHSEPRDDQCDMTLDLRYYTRQRQAVDAAMPNAGADHGA